MINKTTIENVLNAALETGGDFAEIFVEDKWSTNILLISQKVEKALSGRDFGVGIRIFKNLFSVYAYTNDASEENLIKVAREAASSLKGKREDIILNLIKQDIEDKHKILLMPNTVEKKDKVEILKLADKSARDYNNLISQVNCSLADSIQNVLIANSEGTLVEDTRVRTRISIESIASNGDKMQTGSTRPGAAKGFEFIKELDIEKNATEASRMAVTMLNADYAPSGKMPVIIENEFGGVIFHEACGHGLEASAVAKGHSVFANKIGQKVASDCVTAIDDGTLVNEWGSLNIDDEGVPTERKVLIENGILKGYMIDKLNGRRMGMESTGSGRRESYKFAPTSRMTNTFIDNGNSTLEEMLSKAENGLYCRYLGGGSVNPATGDFNFSALEAYLIENGKITKPVKGATLIGNGPEILTKIEMVGNNLGHGQGMCGSSSGSICANVGQPTILIGNMTIGGRN
ncbi:MAG: TldD/PmbA family protein [Fusobacteriaceae bacterium]|nr:TldD/PmbA family protein [Fusobacteriaceae bacterium]MBN2837447.1 TldD/PmbA family protein [Fusobacteriaceae bacterium]